MLEPCAVLDWAASGAMALTGLPNGTPVTSPAPVLAMLGTVTDQFAQVTRNTGTRVSADPAELITVRAALAGFSRRGRISAGGSSYLLRAADGWCAVTLSRRDDLAAVPAILGVLGLHGAELAAEPPAALAAAVLARPAGELAAAAQLLGVPAAALPTATMPMTGSWPPWRTARIAPPSASARLAGAVVADLSSMWAGPLCARLLGLAGAEVIKVESPDRPDGTRSGDREFFDWLHGGHRSLAANFGTGAGRAGQPRRGRSSDGRPKCSLDLRPFPFHDRRHECSSHTDRRWAKLGPAGRALPGRPAPRPCRMERGPARRTRARAAGGGRPALLLADPAQPEHR